MFSYLYFPQINSTSLNYHEIPIPIFLIIIIFCLISSCTWFFVSREAKTLLELSMLKNKLIISLMAGSLGLRFKFVYQFLGVSLYRSTLIIPNNFFIVFPLGRFAIRLLFPNLFHALHVEDSQQLWLDCVEDYQKLWLDCAKNYGLIIVYYCSLPCTIVFCI